MPLVELGGNLYVVEADWDRKGWNGLTRNKLRSSTSRATPIASATDLGYLIFTSKRTSSRSPQQNKLLGMVPEGR